MNAHTNDVQIIEQNGQPAFAVIPYAEYLELTTQPQPKITIPNEVVGLIVENDWNLVKAWRKYLGMSQKDLASKAGISQPAMSQMERSDNLRSSTIVKLAEAMRINPEQLVD